jgi:HK97 family phage prohead protease
MLKTTAFSRLAEIKKRGPLSRSAEFGAVDKASRTVELSFSSETAEVRRDFGVEVLSHDPGACDLSRLNDGAAVLWDHNMSDQRGVVEHGTARIGSDRKGRCVIRLSRSAAGEQLLQDIADRIVTKVSVGYFVNGMRQIETRADGVDVWVITKWTPYEISLVSIPADASVGIGRSAETLNQTRHINPMSNAVNAKSVLSNLIKSARSASGYIEHTPPGFTEPTTRTKVPAVKSGALDLRTMILMPPASATQKSIKSAPLIENRSRSIEVSAAIIGNSVVAGLGATVIIAADRDIAYSGTQPVFYTDAGLFRTVEPAHFGAVADGAGATISACPWSDAKISWPDAPSVAFRAIITRSQMKDVGGDLIEDNLLEAILAGLSEAADRTLLTAITAANPAAFTLGAAAARGLQFGNLRAAIGTSANGAAVGQDGVLRAAGIGGELTRTMLPTIIGDFRKSAIAINPEITLHMERMDVNGNIGCLVFANMLPLVPDSSAFWIAGA